jgi:hypothetical protein
VGGGLRNRRNHLPQDYLREKDAISTQDRPHKSWFMNGESDEPHPEALLNPLGALKGNAKILRRWRRLAPTGPMSHNLREIHIPPVTEGLPMEGNSSVMRGCIFLVTFSLFSIIKRS